MTYEQWWLFQAGASAVVALGFLYLAVKWKQGSPRRWPLLVILGLALIAGGNVVTSWATGHGEDELRNAAGAFIRGVLFVLLMVGMSHHRD